MNIPAEYLNGLDDVAAQLQAIIAGTYTTDAIIPEPLPQTISRLAGHVQLMVKMYPDANLARFADIANQARALVEEI
jgi:hypothetical protein